ncbi:MAG TPA: hypothetical protein VGS57_08270 [Thermoanaerobaculia bacterium]|nr:hypothetical protein [Thermoanaerobaculia bacterium]
MATFPPPNPSASPTPSPTPNPVAGPTFDSWAWSSFAAFNWPAQPDVGQPTGYLRGVPNTTASFVGAGPADVLVWETFKEKREVFNNTVGAYGDNVAAGWQAITFSPDQEIDKNGGEVPACSDEDRQRAAKLPGGAHRRILQASKLAPALANTVDETAEVASPAQEAQSQLCAGYGTGNLPPYDQPCAQTFPTPPGGNSGTVFPPDILNPRGAVGPRVFDPAGNLVYYEVRVNYDYFNYVLKNNLYLLNPPASPTPTPMATPTPTVPPPPYQLPWRSSAPKPPANGGAGQQPGVTSYDADAAVTTYGSSPITPPPVGSVQVKSAWMQLSQPDPSYHNTEALYFSTDPKAHDPEKVCYRVGTFGLIGLHIIQRVHMGTASDGNANPVGGTFIFATWEHTSIGNGGGYRYVNFLTKGDVPEHPFPYPEPSHAIEVAREHPYPLATTQEITAAVHKELGCPPTGNTGSVWCNYRLVGTQFYALSDATTSAAYNQPFFLANLVVETNRGLQNFQGLPPKITPISQYQGFTPTGAPYNPTVPNVSWNGHPYNMGGCMGCHGVAQVLGSNFSFVLLDGQTGAGIDTPATVQIPPEPPPAATPTPTPAMQPSH